MSDKKRIFRAKHDEDFIVYHLSVASDKNLSYEALGLLMHLQTLPQMWVRIRSLPRAGAGIAKVRKLCRELKSAGYVDMENGLGVRRKQ